MPSTTRLIQPADAERMFRASVPEAMLREIVSTIRERTAWALAKSEELFAAPHCREVRPGLRRAGIHQELATLPARYPEVRTVLKKTSGNWVALQIEVNDVLLLIGRVPHPDAMVPRAAYRVEIATASMQISLFGDEEPSSDAKLYGLVLYGGDLGRPEPGFIVVRFPERDHRRYLWPRIDLLAEYGAPIDGAPLEAEQGAPVLQLRQWPATGSETS